MLFNVQKLFQTADNEVRVAGQEGHIEREGGKKKSGCRWLQNPGIEIKILNPLENI